MCSFLPFMWLDMPILRHQNTTSFTTSKSSGFCGYQVPLHHLSELSFDELALSHILSLHTDEQRPSRMTGSSRPSHRLSLPRPTCSAAYRAVSCRRRSVRRLSSATKRTRETKKSGVASAVCLPATIDKDLQQCARSSTNTPKQMVYRPNCQ